MLPLGRRVALGVIRVPDGLELGRDSRVRGGREVLACDDLQRNMLEAMQARNDRAAKAEGRGVSEDDEDV